MTLWKQFIVWALVIVVGGGLLSLALGHGFFGEKEPASFAPSPAYMGPPIPTQGPKCDPNRACADCHEDK